MLWITFVDNWDDKAFTASTIQLYIKKVPAKESESKFINWGTHQLNEADRR